MPFWQPDPDIALSIVPDDESGVGMPVFDPWAIPGRKALGHDGRRLALKLCQRGRFWHLSIAGALGAGMPFTFAITPDGRAGARLREAQDMMAVIANGPANFAGQRGATEPIITMQSLQALDGYLAGASERDIAIVIFGQRIVAKKWHGDSELRAKVRYLIRRGCNLMSGGYRRFLWGAAARRAGEFTILATATTGRKSTRDISPSRTR